MAESLLIWYAKKFRSDRLDAATIAATKAAMPNRLAYFDALPFVIADPPASADFDNDDDVDDSDLAKWSDAFGLVDAGDADGDRDSDGTDFLIWQRQLDTLSMSSVTSQIVPEPAGYVLVFAASYTLVAFRRR